MWLGSFFMLTKRVRRDRSFDKHRTRRIGQFSCTGTPCSFYSRTRKLCSYAALLYFVISSSTLSRSEIFPVFTSSSICTQSLTAAFNSSAAYWRDMGI